MKLIEDKEVGELWRKNLEWIARYDDEPRKGMWPYQVQQLIRKLVHERKMYYWRIGKSKDEALSFALRDFGIDPEDWPA